MVDVPYQKKKIQTFFEKKSLIVEKILLTKITISYCVKILQSCYKTTKPAVTNILFFNLKCLSNEFDFMNQCIYISFIIPDQILLHDL